jgi:rubrerythrin
LRHAIKAERDGHSFYRMAADSSKDPKAKEVFGQLAREELDHLEFLTQHYEAALKTGRPSESAALGKRVDLSGSSPIFSSGIKDRLREAHLEMSALSIGIRLELDAMNFYRSHAEDADNPDVRKLYNELAEWEAGHYEALLRQQEALKEDYWSESRFSPF